MDCRVETKVSPRNDNFGAYRVTLVVIAHNCGLFFVIEGFSPALERSCFFTLIFVLSARKTSPTIRKFSKFLSKINQIMAFVIAKA